MRVRIIRETTGPNPAYDPRKPSHPQDNAPIRVLPVDTEIEGPKAWLHCLGRYDEPPVAEPIDEEAKAKVAERLAARQQRDQGQAQKVEFPAVPSTPRRKPAEPPKVG